MSAPRIGRPKPEPKGPALPDIIDEQIKALLNDPDLKREDRLKLLTTCIKWAAVKSQIVLGDHGSGFDDLGDDE